MDSTRTLAERRKEMGLSQAELAGILSVTQATVSRNETAEKPDARYVLALEAIEARRAARAASEGASAEVRAA